VETLPASGGSQIEILFGSLPQNSVWQSSVWLVSEGLPAVTSRLGLERLRRACSFIFFFWYLCLLLVFQRNLSDAQWG
jgi:hypothetical protein